MHRIDIIFIVLATICLMIGVSMGIWMGIAHDFQLAPVHAHLNLLGWASLGLFGLCYRAYPELARSRLALAHFMTSATGAVALPAGIYLSIVHESPGLAIAASFVWLLGVMLFLANLIRACLIAPRRERDSVPHGPGLEPSLG